MEHNDNPAPEQDDTDQNFLQTSQEDIKRKPPAFSTENMDHLRELLKQSENKFDDVSEILSMIMNSDDEKSPEMNYKVYLDALTDDLQNIKTKLGSVESKVTTLRKDYLNETPVVKQEYTKSRKAKTEYYDDDYDYDEDYEPMMRPKVEMEEYYDDDYLETLEEKLMEDEDDFIDDEDFNYIAPARSKTKKKRLKNKYGEKSEKTECEICYKRVSNLRLHKRNRHSGSASYNCDMCDKSLKSAKLMAQHKAKQHKTNNFKCNSCNYSHASLQSVRRHILENHETHQIPYVTQMDSMINTYVCYKKVCPFESFNLNDHKVHMREIHGENIDHLNPKERHNYGEMKCQFCDFMKFSLPQLKKHLKHEHSDNVGENTIVHVTEVLHPEIKHFFCMRSKCPFTSTTVADLQSHTLRYHAVFGDDGPLKQENDENGENSSSTEVYQCPKCEYKTRNNTCFMDHINGELKFRKCPFCDNHFTMKNKDFKRHLQTHDNCYDEKAKSWFCYICCMKFKRDNVSTYLTHIFKEHKIGTPYHCYKCDFSTGSYENIEKHATVHNESAIPCPHCSYIAQSKQRLSKHIYNAHSYHECRECDIKFKVKQEYLMHMKDHEEVNQSGENKSFCDHCGSFFTTHKELFLHKIQIRQESKKPTSITVGEFYCPICNVKCSRMCALQKHMKNKHSGDDSDMMHCEEPGCAYKTRTKDGMKNHVEKVHLGIRWPCDQCKFVGAYKADLKRHVKIVHDGFALHCDQCDFRSPHKYVLEKHRDTAHSLVIK